VACHGRWRSTLRSPWEGRCVSALLFLSVQPEFISWHPIGPECATQPVSSCRGAWLMGIYVGFLCCIYMHIVHIKYNNSQKAPPLPPVQTHNRYATAGFKKKSPGSFSLRRFSRSDNFQQMQDCAFADRPV
jgi:hypothetical protein